MRIVDYLAAKNLPVEQFAALLRCPVREVLDWIAEAKRPDWAMLDEIAKVTGGRVTADDFMNSPPTRWRTTDDNRGFEDAAGTLAADLMSTDENAAVAIFRDKKAREWLTHNNSIVLAWGRWAMDRPWPSRKRDP